MSETPAGSPAPDPLAVIGELTTVLEGVREDLRSLRDELRSVREDSEDRDKALAADARRSRRIITGLVVSFCVDLIVTAGFGYNTIRVNDAQAATRAAQVASHASNIRQCQLANVSRAQDIAIWNRALKIPATAPAAQKALVADLGRLVRVKDAPRDCTAAHSK